MSFVICHLSFVIGLCSPAPGAPGASLHPYPLHIPSQMCNNR
ncbi:hypothetical protein [Coleofasciculus sp. F4-SAH-05]